MTRAPLLLAIDTSTATAVIAVGHGERVLASSHEPAPRAYDEGLLPHVEGVLRRARVRLADVDAVVCGCGPGSFTGLRIAMATAKGYAFALDRPLLLVSSTAATAFAARRAASVVVLLDAKRGQILAQTFLLGRWRPSSRPRSVIEEARAILDPRDLGGWIAARGLPKPIVAVGQIPDAPAPCARFSGGIVVQAIRFPLGGCLLELARSEWSAGRFADLDAAEPEYIRPPPFNPPRGGPRLARGSRGVPAKPVKPGARDLKPEACSCPSQ